METKKIMLYSTEDKRMGFKPVKFNFAEGTKIRNKETGKIMICEGVYDLSEWALPRFAKAFRKLTRITGFPRLFWLSDLRSYAQALADNDYTRVDVCEFNIAQK